MYEYIEKLIENSTGLETSYNRRPDGVPGVTYTVIEEYSGLEGDGKTDVRIGICIIEYWYQNEEKKHKKIVMNLRDAIEKVYTSCRIENDSDMSARAYRFRITFEFLVEEE